MLKSTKDLQEMFVTPIFTLQFKLPRHSMNTFFLKHNVQ